MAGNKSLGKAKDAKKDEFYTQLSDIENELSHYRQHFRGKTVFCNCDDPYESNFVKYFALNFNALGLKRLIATCYATSPVMYTQLSFFGDPTPLGEAESGKKPYYIDITEITDQNGDGAVNLTDFEIILKKHPPKTLQGDGDFRSDECVELLKQADIVVTNPPFSLFREYVAQLIQYDKKFIIIGNQNAIHYKEIFPLIQQNQLWLGYGFKNGNAYFSIPSQETSRFANGVYNSETGLVKFRNCVWLTNIDIKKRHENMILFRTYSPDDFPKYENYDAIEVSKTADIPCDYDGCMGVPDTFLDKYNPEQFEIIGLGSGYLGQSIGVGAIAPEHKQMMTSHAAAGDLYYLLPNGKPKIPYSRIIIRKKKQQ